MEKKTEIFKPVYGVLPWWWDFVLSSWLSLRILVSPSAVLQPRHVLINFTAIFRLSSAVQIKWIAL